MGENILLKNHLISPCPIYSIATTLGLTPFLCYYFLFYLQEVPGVLQAILEELFEVSYLIFIHG